MTTTNIHTYWKSDKDLLSHSVIHYLYAIDQLNDTNGFAKLSDIAKVLNITPGSTCIGLKKLFKKELAISSNPGKHIHLTKKAQKIIDQVKVNRSVLENFFIKQLHLSPEIAKANACKIEHIVDIDVINALK